MLSEHLEYLSDPRRLRLFERAIASAVQPGDTVADLGCGFGILGLLCLRAGAAHVWGIDETDAIDVARETMAKEGLSERYTCLGETSFRVSLPEQVDVLICDHVGHFGIDYGILNMISDAHQRFLKPGGRILPAQIRLSLAAVESKECRDKLTAWSPGKVPSEFSWLQNWELNAKHAHSFREAEICTSAEVVGTIDLAATIEDHFTFSATLAAERDAVIDGLAGWFECELADDIWMTNSPLSADKIARDQAFFPLEEPFEVRKGDLLDVSLTIRHGEGLMAWSIYAPRTGSRAKQSNWNSFVLTKDTLGDRVPQMSRIGLARKVVLEQVDGRRTNKEIEEAVLAQHPDLFPSPAEISRFVQTELARSTE